MSRLGRDLLRLVALVGALACALALLLLFDLRPPLPSLPRSLSSPLTLPLLRGTLELAAWGLSLLLAGLLLGRAVAALLARSRPRPARIHPTATPRARPLGQVRLAAGVAQDGFPPPFPLILHRDRERNGQPEPVPAPAPIGTAVVTQRREPAATTLAQTPPRPCLLPPSIALLGPLEIAPAKPRRRRLRSQTQQLLAHLALHPDGVTGDELVAALWPGIDDENARMRLWRSASEARGQLGEVISRSGERYQLDRQAVAVDLDRFEALLAAADVDTADRQAQLEQALALVRGQPLAGSDYPWAAGETRRLLATIVDRLQELGYLRLDSSDPAGALAAAEQALTLDPLNEGAHRLAMQAEAGLGLRQAVSARYQQLRERLDARFGLEPERETRLLHRRLLSQDHDHASQSPTR
jgi:DNA-binding SARP family transcriptional activator